MKYRVTHQLLASTFSQLRSCGKGVRECQVLWIGPWTDPSLITQVVHPQHTACAGGFQLNSNWLNDFWLHLAETRAGIRVQVHTHPREAFHSAVDDAYPVIHSAGFLSLVIPNFASGKVGFDDAHLAELGANGRWRGVPVLSRFEVQQ